MRAQWLEVKVGNRTVRLTAFDFSWLRFLSRVYELLGRSEAEACFHDAAWHTARWISQVLESARVYVREKPVSIKNAGRLCEQVATFARSRGWGNIQPERIEEDRLVFRVEPGLQKGAHDLGLLHCVACPIFKGWLSGTTSFIEGFEENDVHETDCLYRGSQFCRFEVLKRVLAEEK